MKNLDLNKYGVQEMNAEEMKKTDGGLWWVGLGVGILSALAWDIISNPKQSSAAVRRGFDSVQ